MAYIECDTNKLRTDGNQILQLVDSLREVMLEYYKRIEKMSIVTGEWTGNTAEKYTYKVVSSKQNVMAFCDSLASYGRYFINNADQIDATIKRNMM